MMTRRPPTYALQGWYPADPETLQADLDRYLAEAGSAESRAVRAVIAPHAGYRYCGHVAGATYGQVAVPPVVVVIGLNHGHRGAPYATQLSGSWLVPGGEVRICEPLARAVQEASGVLQDDPRVLEQEHSLEMQVPFLWRRRPEVQLVPIQLRGMLETEMLQLGERIAQAIREYEATTGQSVLLVASSDLHHQEQDFRARDDRRTREQDERAIEPILAFDPVGLVRRVEAEEITMCGYIPAGVVLTAARQLGATSVTLVRHATSAEIPPHNYGYVVGYAGFLIH